MKFRFKKTKSKYIKGLISADLSQRETLSHTDETK